MIQDNNTLLNVEDLLYNLPFPIVVAQAKYPTSAVASRNGNSAVGAATEMLNRLGCDFADDRRDLC